MSEFRALPSVDQLQRAPRLAEFDAVIRVSAARQAIDQAREQVKRGQANSREEIEDQAALIAAELAQATLRPVINLSGVILHTGLGRARLAPAAVEAIQAAAGSHSSLEIDLESGERGDRQSHVRDLLRELTGCEDALVVNNNAAAVILVLAAVAAGGEVVLSRGQMVEIGGAFRMPDIIRQSGCTLVEVGCTNKTHLDDYGRVLGDQTRAILRCHPSNFALIGFHGEPALKDLAELARRHGCPLIDDVGSGCLLDTTRFGLTKEPTLAEALAQGADIVTASGDKLLGGPQAGLILGRKEWIDQIRRHPLARAMRIDKLSLAGLAETLRLYRAGREQEIPIWNSIGKEPSAVRKVATTLQRSWAGRSVVAQGETQVGGGSMPLARIPTWRLGLESDRPDQLAKALRTRATPIIGRIEDGLVWLDPRTLEPAELRIVQQALQELG